MSHTMTYTRTRYQQLKDAYAAAIAKYQAGGTKRTFDVMFEGMTQPRTFAFHQARELIDGMAADFARPDLPRQPHNEGEEGQ